MRTGHFCSKAFEILLLLTLFLVPLAFSPFFVKVFVIPKTFIFQLGTLLAALSLSCSILFYHEFQFAKLKFLHKLAIYLSIFLFLMIGLSTIFSTLPNVSLWGSFFRMQGFIAFFHYFLFALLVFVYIQQNESNIIKLIGTIIISATIASSYAIIQKIGLDQIPWNDSELLGRVFGTMSNPNALAQYLVLSLSLTIAAFVAYKKRVLIFIAFIIQFAALIFTQGRASTLALIIALLVFTYFVSKVKHRKIIFKLALSLFLIVIITIGTLNFFRNNQTLNKIPLVNRVLYSDANLRSFKVRALLWETGLPLVSLNPVLGHGADTFKIVYPKYRAPELNTLEDLNASADRTHNELLDIAIFFGTPALLAYLLIFAISCLISFRFIKKNKNFSDSVIVMGLQTALISYFLSTLLGFSLTAHYMLLGTLLACLFGFTAIKSTEKRRNLDLKFNIFTGYISLFLLIVFSIFMISYVYASPFRADYLHKISLKELNDPTVSPMEALAPLEKAFNIMPAFSEYAKNYAIFTLRFLNDQEVTNEQKKILIDNSLQILKEAITFNPVDSYLYVYSALLHSHLSSNSGDVTEFNEAMWNMRKAVELNPQKPDVYLHYANIYYDNAAYRFSSFSSAIEMYEKYLSLVPDYWKWKDLSGKSDYEQQLHRVFFKLNPNFDQSLINLGRSFASAGNFKKAIFYLDFADDDNYEKYVVLGDIYKFSDQFSSAVRAYKKALDLSPDNPTILKALKEVSTGDDSLYEVVRRRVK